MKISTSLKINIIFAKILIRFWKTQNPIKKSPPPKKKNQKKEQKGTQVGAHIVVAKPSLFFWLNLSIWLKEISIWLNPYTYFLGF
jgi:hypothetical protein